MKPNIIRCKYCDKPIILCIYNGKELICEFRNTKNGHDEIGITEHYCSFNYYDVYEVKK